MGLNKPVDFSTAKLLKEKGFEERTECAYKTDSTLISFKGQGGINANLNYLVGIKYNKFRQNTKNALTSAPTIAQVIMWCFKTHKIWITVDVNINGKFNYLLRQFNSKDRAWEVKNPSSIQEYFNNPDDAYSSGITYFLNNLEMSN